MYWLPTLREAATDQWDQRAVLYVEVEVIASTVCPNWRGVPKRIP